MKNERIGTKLGLIIIIILTATIALLVWNYEKKMDFKESNDRQDAMETVSSLRESLTQKSIQENLQQKSGDEKIIESTETSQKEKQETINQKLKEVLQPSMPSSEDEAKKSPEELVKDFYEWYIGNINYNYYLARKSKGKDWINIQTLIQKSPFISSTYEKNMNKTSGGADPILCSQDTDNNKFIRTEELVISGNNAKIYTIMESEWNIKIQVILKKEENQWKIDEINCDYFRL